MTNAQPEPSMEEILASIRRIISEDEEDHPGADRSALDRPAMDRPVVEQKAPVATVREVPKVAAPTPSHQSTQDQALNRMLDRAESNRTAGVAQNKPTHADNQPAVPVPTARISQPAVTDDDEAHNELTTEDVKMVKHQAAAFQDEDDMIVDTTTARAAAAAFGNLSRTVRVSEGDGQTLETMVTEMLRPMVKEWLDKNLSRIVEEKVEYEVQRLSRRG